MEILLIEPDHLISGFIRRGLSKYGYKIHVRFEVPKHIEHKGTKLIIIDYDINGGSEPLNFVKKLRDSSVHTPVLFLTSKESERYSSKIYASGADEVIKKPFSLLELNEKLGELQDLGVATKSKLLRYKNIELDLTNNKVWKKKKELILTKKEFDLLAFFMNNPNKIVRKEDIIFNVWDYDADIRNNTVEVYIGYLRSKIEDKNEVLIQTRRGFGYIFGS